MERAHLHTDRHGIAWIALCCATILGCAEADTRTRRDTGADTGAGDVGPVGDGAADGASPDGALEGLTVSSVTPAVGPTKGGTAVTIAGSGFADGATVDFGDRPGTDVVLVSAFQLKVTTPAADDPGSRAVTVTNPGGERATLEEAFEYRDPQPTEVDLCKLQGPATLTTQPGVASAPVFGRVWEQGCTDGAKQCATITAELGHGPASVDPSQNPGAFAWAKATYNAGHTADDSDEHRATLTVAAEGSYAYAYRFSIDGGKGWTYCDLDGSQNGFDQAQMGQLTVEPEALAVSWCTLHWPKTAETLPGQPTAPIFGRVFVAGCTEGAAQCAEVSGQLGYGPASTDPQGNPAAFTWVDAAQNAAHTGDDNDEHTATLTVAAAGSYAFAFRFSVDGGQSWTLCDLDGSTNGFSATEMGRLTVGTPAVDWCTLQHPTQVDAAPGVATEPIFGRVLVAGCSEGQKHCAEVSAQLGYGDPTKDPTKDPASYTWVDAAYNVGHTADDNDEYQATLTAATDGSYGYAYRVSLDGGQSWTYCDADGSANGFDLALLGALEVTKPPAGVAWCSTQWPASAEVAPGVPSPPIFGRVYEPGCTDGAQHCAQISAQLGYGDPAVDASTSPGDYTWVDASYNAAHTATDNDEHLATLTIATPGSYAYAYRFSNDGGQSWTYCDRDGSANGFDQADQTGQLTVAPSSQTLGWCNLQSPATVVTVAAAATVPIYGRVYVAGCTDGAAECQAITAQLGHGSPGADPATSPESYAWVDASYNTGHTSDDNDEHTATLTPAAAGSFAYAFRFSIDSGQSWTYCDLDGSLNGVQADQLGALTVTVPAVDWCELKHPTSTSTAPGVASEPVFGRAHVAGCTDGAARCAGLLAELGHGAPGADPEADPAAFTWLEAGYNAAHTADDNDEHQATLTVPTAGSYAYAYRFSTDGGQSWTYCDTDGSDGLSTSQLGQLEVATRSIDWCNVQHPSAVTVATGDAPPTVYGRVLVTGCTEGASVCHGLLAELGYGAAGSDPAADPAAYTWLAASHNVGHTSSNNDEYTATLPVGQAGTFGYAYRFSGDGGQSWTYCDTSGDAFSAADVGQLTVQ